MSGRLLGFSPVALPLSLSDLCEKQDAAARPDTPTLPFDSQVSS